MKAFGKRSKPKASNSPRANHHDSPHTRRATQPQKPPPADQPVGVCRITTFAYLCNRRTKKERTMRSYDAVYIARKVINMTNTEQGDSITNLKLQKLLYYLQGFWLAYYGVPLFVDDIEAWMYGPVVPSVYDAFKERGNRAIEPTEEELPLDTADEESFFREVYDTYSQFSAVALMGMTHGEAPWSTTSMGRGSVIGKDKLMEFFKKRLV